MRNRRKKRFVDSVVQGSLVRRITLHWLIFFVMASITMALWQLMTSPRFDGPFLTLILKSWSKTAPVLVVLAAMLPIFVWDTITFSHRFAGPMYRFHATVKRLAAGETVEPIRLRKGDFWKDFADDFNAMVQRWQSEPRRDTSVAEEEDEEEFVAMTEQT